MGVRSLNWVILKGAEPIPITRQDLRSFAGRLWAHNISQIEPSCLSNVTGGGPNSHMFPHSLLWDPLTSKTQQFEFYREKRKKKKREKLVSRVVWGQPNQITLDQAERERKRKEKERNWTPSEELDSLHSPNGLFSLSLIFMHIYI
jgi:hypothetical protein